MTGIDATENTILDLAPALQTEVTEEEGIEIATAEIVKITNEGIDAPGHPMDRAEEKESDIDLRFPDT